MKKMRRQLGGTLVLILCLVLVLAIGAVFIFFNVGGLLGYQKQAQTSIDAAALAVTRDLQRVTVLHKRLGRVGIVDQYGASGLQQRPTLGINTLLALVRLDSIVAKELDCDTMLALARYDRDDTKDAASDLAQAIFSYAQGTSGAEDVNGAPLKATDLRKVAADAYNANNRRLGMNNSVDLKPEDFTIEVGCFDQLNAGARGITNIPVPQPEAMARVDSSSSTRINGDLLYRSYVPIQGPAGDMILSAVADQVRLVDNHLFAAYAPSKDGIVPTVVRVRAREGVRPVAKSAGGQQGMVSNVACAQMGSPRLTATSGMLRVEFPQGMPLAGSPPPFDGNKVTIAGIMNASKISNVKSLNTGAAPWAGNGAYFRATGGAFPGKGAISRSDFLGRTVDNPSVSLAFFVYDWLRHDGLRPNVSAVVKTLRDTDLRNEPFGQTTVVAHDRVIMIEPAIAQGVVGGANQKNVYGALFNIVDPDVAMQPGEDARSRVNFSAATRQQYNEQSRTFEMEPLAAQQVAWAPQSNTAASGVDGKGDVATANGFPIKDLYDFETTLLKTKQYAIETNKAAESVVANSNPAVAAAKARLDQAEVALTQAKNDYLKALDDANGNEKDGTVVAAAATVSSATSERDAARSASNALLVNVQRAKNASDNALLAQRVAEKIIDNLLSITAIGVQKKSADEFVIAGNIPFFPLGRAATEADISGVTPVATGQAVTAPGTRNWIEKNIYVALGTAGTVTIASDFAKDHWLPLAVAQSVVPSSQLRNFRFVVTGDAGSGGGNVMVSTSANGPGPTVNTQSVLNGQINYQALNVYREPVSGTNPCGMAWSIMARDNYYSTDADVRLASEEGNVLDCSRAQQSNNVDAACDSEVVRWQFTSPLPICPTPPIPPGQPPAESH